jgi:hypothetical protein
MLWLGVAVSLALTLSDRAYGQTVKYKISTEYAAAGIVVVPLSEARAKELPLSTDQVARVEQCPGLKPYLLGVWDREDRLEWVVTRVARGKDMGAQVMMVPGKRQSPVVIAGAEGGVVYYLNPSLAVEGAYPCQDLEQRFAAMAKGREVEVSLDSVTLKDGTLVGDDLMGMVRRSENEAAALRALAKELAAVSLGRGELGKMLEQIVEAARVKNDMRPGHSYDYYVATMERTARMLAHELQQGKTVEQVKEMVQKMAAAHKVLVKRGS